MNQALLGMTEKVSHMFRSMVYFAMSRNDRGATVADICDCIGESIAGDARRYHAGVVERALGDLERQGRVVRYGALWYPRGQGL